MTKKIFRSIVLVVLLVLVLSFSVITGVLYSHFQLETRNKLESELLYAANAIETKGIEAIEDFKNSIYRVTVVEKNGKVIFDSETNVESMDNHADREEIMEARAGEIGESFRYSNTLTHRMIYLAKKAKNGLVVRLSTRIDSIFILLLDVLIPMLFIMILSIVLSAVLAQWMAKKVVKPLNGLDLDNPLENETYDELAPILNKINKQHLQISEQLDLLKAKTKEFDQITASMNEGLILLDKKGNILSMNSAAKRIFGVHGTFEKKDFLSVDRSIEMSQAIKQAMKEKHVELRAERFGAEYQFDISSIETDNEVVGLVILCFDITEKVHSEKIRQEFTANVSHELKTPLQTIIGSAELFENGLVKQEDSNRFISHIKNEANRLISLIDDIIHLSQLDENASIPMEDVELKSLARDVVDELELVAGKKNVEVTLSGTPCIIKGIRRYLYQVIYNLCDNAIRYNKDGGKVQVDISDEKRQIAVSDTGIGIPLEHQSRIFERFYRVDKSHSRQTGGTGLGLSIVKHAVALHNGTIKLESEEGRGSRITITF